MWLRGGLPDDPILVIDPVERARIEHRQIALPWAVQHVTGGVAYDITVTTDPRVGNEIATTRDIPGRHGAFVSGALAVELDSLREHLRLLPDHSAKVTRIWLVARYTDRWACEWESRRAVDLIFPDQLQPGFTPGSEIGPERVMARKTPEVMHRLVSLPPKRFASPP
jgi:hypothetical protein